MEKTNEDNINAAIDDSQVDTDDNFNEFEGIKMKMASSESQCCEDNEQEKECSNVNKSTNAKTKSIVSLKKSKSTTQLSCNDKNEKSHTDRETLSESNVLVQPLKSFSILKAKIEGKIKSTSGKLCKDCIYSSIESHLSVLGIVKKENTDIDILEADHIKECKESDHLLENDEKTTNEEKKRSETGFLQSLHRRTLSEIDWHELTKFAQGELFDPDSGTAREIKRVIEEGKDELSIAFKMMHSMDFDYVVEQGEKCVQCVINTGWNVVSHWELPQWLRDNDFLWHMHRPQLPSFKECFCSMFRVHTETGNIWTHLIGMVLIMIAMLFVLLRPARTLTDFPKGWEEYLVFTSFFFGAITCLMFSWLYHTCSCHSKKVTSLFSKLDYTGIACMIMGSMIPAMYFSFYCHFIVKVVYVSIIMVLGTCSIVVALWDKFASPAFRPIRAGLFLCLGCSAIVPVIHMLILHGTERGLKQGQVMWMTIMGVCYISGALLYAARIPERFFPGKCNIVFQSHQIFHILVVVGAFIHLHACCEMALFRIQLGRSCAMTMSSSMTTPMTTRYYNSTFTGEF